ncbi:hypothetical protein SRIMM317S_00610 [Streptomyces rimosus subsp. rimosus]
MTATAVVLGVTGMLAGTAPAAYADPGPTVSETRLEEVRTQLENLYRAAEKATEAYNAAKEQVDLQQKEIVKLARNWSDAAADGRTQAPGGRAGQRADRGGGIPPEARLMLNKDPSAFSTTPRWYARASTPPTT